MNKLFTTLKQFWGTLPHEVQAGILLFTTSAGTVLTREFSELAMGQQAFTWLTLRHDIAGAIFAGFIAVRALYMLPNGTAQLVAQAKAENAANPAVATPPKA